MIMLRDCFYRNKTWLIIAKFILYALTKKLSLCHTQFSLVYLKHLPFYDRKGCKVIHCTVFDYASQCTKQHKS